MTIHSIKAFLDSLDKTQLSDDQLDFAGSLNSSIGHFAPSKEIAIIWSVEDVRASHEGTDEECMEVLYNVEHRHDANIGVSWDTLEIHGDILGLRRAGDVDDDEEEEDEEEGEENEEEEREAL